MNTTASVSEPSVPPPTETRPLVKQAADELLADGIRPTVANVRARIGRGSATTINAALGDWWQQLAGRLAKAGDRPDVPAPLLELAERLWDAALVQAHDALKTHREEADQRVARAAEIEAAALLARDQAHQKFSDLQQQHQQLGEIRLDLERRLTAEAEKRQHAEARVLVVQAEAVAQAEALRARIRELEELLRREQARFDSMERRLSLQVDEQKTARVETETRHRDDATAWRTERNDLIGQVRQAQERSAELNGRITTLLAQISELRDAYVALQTEKETLVASHARLETTASQAQKIEDSLRGEISALREINEAIETGRRSLREDLEDARKTLAAAVAEGQSS